MLKQSARKASDGGSIPPSSTNDAQYQATIFCWLDNRRLESYEVRANL